MPAFSLFRVICAFQSSTGIRSDKVSPMSPPSQYSRVKNMTLAYWENVGKWYVGKIHICFADDDAWQRPSGDMYVQGREWSSCPFGLQDNIARWRGTMLLRIAQISTCINYTDKLRRFQLIIIYSRSKSIHRAPRNIRFYHQPWWSYLLPPIVSPIIPPSRRTALYRYINHSPSLYY